ncbi:hypothetical protein HAX54_022993 [Datura stramonium]|uniref:SNF2 N-terminal domain-containing protein n=1 Tax=Datura stramonium TaxID=4076 RepID=A0ABS8UVD1_DATST|nr:hypothetical protein [Datura stramonium]
MGKTVQAIALVLAKRKLQKPTSDSSILSSSPGTSQKLPVVKGTLVVCPVVGAMQWFREIERCTTIGSNKTLVYHGANRGKYMYKLAEYDFVITTYSTIEADYWPKKVKKHKSVPVKIYPGRKSVLHSVKWDRIILDEATKNSEKPIDKTYQKERGTDLALPTKIVTMRKDSLDVHESDFYKSLYSRSRAQFERTEWASGSNEAGDVEQSCDLCLDAVEDQ